MSDPREVQKHAGSKPATARSQIRLVQDRIDLLREVCTMLVEASDPSLRAKLLAILAVVKGDSDGS